MKTHPSARRSRGFTLIELLTVIAIIGILAAILIPAVGGIKAIAQRTTASQNSRQIALAYNTFSSSGSRPRNINKGANSQNEPYAANSVAQFAGILAKRGSLNTAEIWYITADPALASEVNNLADIKLVLDNPAQDQASASNLTVSPISWAVAVNLPINADASTTPICWTRGLTTSGTWDSDDSPWEGDGGHIAYLDGHVAWYEDLADDPLVNNESSSGGTTTNIGQAVYGSTNILED